jgi:hypothetical protein
MEYLVRPVAYQIAFMEIAKAREALQSKDGRDARRPPVRRRMGGMRGRLGRAWTWQGRGLGNGRAEGLQREGKHSAVMRKARMYMCAMQALCGTTLPSASGRSAFCVAAGFKDAPNRFC